jgi:anti-sigma factor RsiW
VTCDEVLALYSDYVDGLLPAREAVRVQWHLGWCGACARYDRVVRRGAALARELPPVRPSDSFADRLQHRLFHLQDGSAIAEPRTGGGAAALALAGVLALLAWSPALLQPRGTAHDTSAATVLTAGPPVPAELPFGTDNWSAAGLMPVAAPAIVSLRSEGAVQLLAAVPGPYSPLIVEPPLRRAAQ